MQSGATTPEAYISEMPADRQAAFKNYVIQSKKTFQWF